MSVLTNVLCVAYLLKDTVVVLVAHLDIFPSIDQPGSHVELLIARVLDFSPELILQTAVDPPGNRDVLGDGLEKAAECAPAEEEDGSTGTVDDDRIGVVNKCVHDVEDGNEGANKAAEQLRGLAKHSERRLSVFFGGEGHCGITCPQRSEGNNPKEKKNCTPEKGKNREA